MNTISLHGAEFFAYHGFYPEEQKLGNKFIVDVDVEFISKDLKEDDIGATVNYEQLYEIVEKQMKQTRKLIETVAQAISDSVKDQFPIVKKIKVSIRKLNPALKGKVDFSCITLSEP